jgi:hypothetical protein
MPYIILAIGVLIALYALYRFFLNASLVQIKALALSMLAFVIVLGVAAMAITGRLPAALALVVALWPVIVSLMRIRRGLKATAEELKPGSAVLSRKDALEVLGLNEDASEDEIQSAYKKLMLKLHPDTQGSDWMAAKLNQARDILLGKKG